MSNYRDILKKYWGYPDFRPLQEDIIRSVADEGHDTLGLLPTGGGKSIIFQVPALAKDGVCLVITPLIALMKDQVDNLKRRNIKAAAIYSGMTKDEIDITLNNCIYGKIKLLYISPERIETEIFKIRAPQMNVSLVAIDESHCISQWGYDFRPSYLKIAQLRELLPEKVPFLALTATATPVVVDDIQEKLQFSKPNVFKKSFERKNLTYIVRHVEDKLNYLLKIAGKQPGTGIVYVRSRRRTYEIADYLKRNGISADYYHAGIKPEYKDYKQQQWKNGNCRIIVATNAFGMGIDKPDVRFVVHIDLPDSLEAYFQEAGRGGRDEKAAYAVLLYHDTDKQRLERFVNTGFPERKIIKNVYTALGNYYQIPVGGGKGMAFDFNMADFASHYKLPVLTVYNSLKFLQNEGYIEFTDELQNPSRLRFIMQRNELYKLQVKNAKFDAFIKLILRSYTGVFSDYVKIDENLLAKRANVDRNLIYKYLVKLSSQKIINYIPQKKTAMVIYTQERLDDESVRVSREHYESRKQRYIKNIEAVVNYAASTTTCRSQLLLSYFGQTNAARCGQCDVCRRRTELQLTHFEFETMKEKILTRLKATPALTDDVINPFHPHEKKALKVVQWLLENNQIYYRNDKNLIVKE